MFSLTKEGWMTVALSILITFSAINSGVNLLFLISSFMNSAILFNILISLLILFRFSVEIIIPKYSYAHQKFDIQIITNKKYRILSGSISFEISLIKAKPELKEKDSKIKIFSYKYWNLNPFQSSVSVPVRGYYNKALFQVECEFPFGLARAKKEISLPIDLFIFPEIVPVQNLRELSSSRGELVSSTLSNLRGQGELPYGVREYTPGDSIRKIHWRTMAKHQKIIVIDREQEADEKINMVIFSNPFPTSDEFEKILRLATSYSYHLYKNNINYQVVSFLPNFFHYPPGRGYLHHINFMKALAIAGSPITSINRTLFSWVNTNIEPGTTLLMIGPYRDKGFKKFVDSLKLAGYKAVIGTELIPEFHFLPPPNSKTYEGVSANASS